MGANRIYVYDGKNELTLIKDIKAAFTTGELNLYPGDITAIFSVGLHVNLITRERLKVFEDRTGIHAKAKAIVDIVARKDIVNQNNATALLIEV